MPRLHSELARETIAYTAAFLVLHFVCRTLSHYASPTFRRCSPSDKAYWAASMVSTVNAVAVAAVAIQAPAAEPWPTLAAPTHQAHSLP